jgi:hypothetical protein
MVIIISYREKRTAREIVLMGWEKPCCGKDSISGIVAQGKISKWDDVRSNGINCWFCGPS